MLAFHFSDDLFTFLQTLGAMTTTGTENINGKFKEPNSLKEKKGAFPLHFQKFNANDNMDETCRKDSVTGWFFF